MKAIRRAGFASASARMIMPSWTRGLPSIPTTWRLGPIYPTAPRRCRGRRKARSGSPNGRRLIGGRPLVAIGGLTLERALLCLNASGADIAAVVGDIVNNADPVAQAKAWVAATRRKS